MPADRGWTTDELDRIGGSVEVQLASQGPDGRYRSYVTMWVVRDQDQLYVRSAGGPDRPWFTRAVASGQGRIRAGGVERDVAFGETASAAHDAIDAAYHAKYDRYGPTIVGHVVGPDAHAATIRLVAQSDES